VSLGGAADAPLAADIVFRSIQRIGQALAERLERIPAAEPGGSRPEPQVIPAASQRPDSSPIPTAPARRGLGLVPGRVGTPGLTARAAGVAPAATPCSAVDPLAAPRSPARR